MIGDKGTAVARCLRKVLFLMECSMNEYECAIFLARLLVVFPYGVVFNVDVLSRYKNWYGKDLKLGTL
jgi:uncharacterized membrane protein